MPLPSDLHSHVEGLEAMEHLVFLGQTVKLVEQEQVRLVPES